MKLLDRLSDFIDSLNVDDSLEIEDQPKGDSEDKKKEEFNDNYKTLDEQEMEDAKSKITKLFEALCKIKEQLEDVELTPFKRMLLQLKLDLIETRLDRQLARLQLKEFEATIDRLKDEKSQELKAKIKPLEEEYQDILDEKFDLERDIEKLSPLLNKRDPETTYYEQNGRTIRAHTYVINPYLKNELEEKRAALTYLSKKKDAKEDEMEKLKEEYEQMQERFDKVRDDKLMKYNPLTMTWGTIRTFFERAGKTFKEWFATRRLEKEVTKQNVEKAKEDSKKEIRSKIGAIKKNELDKRYENIKNNVEFSNVLKNKLEEKQKAEEISKKDNKDDKEIDLDQIQKNLEGYADKYGFSDHEIRKMKRDSLNNVKDESDKVESNIDLKGVQHSIESYVDKLNLNNSDKDIKKEDSKEDKKEDKKEDTRTSKELTDELVRKIHNNEDATELTKQIVDRITAEAISDYHKGKAKEESEFRRSIKAKKSYEEQQKFAHEIHEKDIKKNVDSKEPTKD